MSTLNVLIIAETVRPAHGDPVEMFTAVGIEHFIAGQGSDVYAALDALERAIASTIAANEEIGREPLCGIKPAPSDIADLLHKPGTNMFSL